MLAGCPWSVSAVSAAAATSTTPRCTARRSASSTVARGVIPGREPKLMLMTLAPSSVAHSTAAATCESSKFVFAFRMEQP
jgi:hypothetical protein